MNPKQILAGPLFQNLMVRSIHLPTPDGPYPVGTREYNLAREEPAPGMADLEDGPVRKIAIKVWYPAEPSDLPVEALFSDTE